MSLLEKLQFWKKEPELDIGKYPALEASPSGEHLEMNPPQDIASPPANLEEIGPGPIPPMQRPAPTAFAQPPMQSQGQDLQVVNAKLDTLKILLENVNAKLDRLEKQQPQEEEKPIPLNVRRWR